MKAILFTLFTFAIVAVYAQPNTDALIKIAGEETKAKKYTKALNALEQAKTELNSLLGDQYLALLPTKIEGWETKPEPPKPDPSKMAQMPMPMTMINGNLASRSFTRKDTSKLPPPQALPVPNGAKVKQPTDTASSTKAFKMPTALANTARTNSLSITISRNAMQAGNITKAHDTTGKQGKAPNGEAVIIKGAKAFQTYSANAQLGTLLVLLGPGTVLEVRGIGIKSTDELTGLVKNLDIDKLVKLAEE